jgi:hypothetical protein
VIVGSKLGDDCGVESAIAGKSGDRVSGKSEDHEIDQEGRSEENGNQLE